jgi:hypothetical protein
VLKKLVRTVVSRDTKVLLDGFVVHFLTIMIRRNHETTLRVLALAPETKADSLLLPSRHQIMSLIRHRQTGDHLNRVR